MKTEIEMAQEAGFTEGELAFMGDNFIRFAELVRADEHERIEHAAIGSVKAAILYEREACAKVCEDLAEKEWADNERCAAAIRARSNT